MTLKIEGLTINEAARLPFAKCPACGSDDNKLILGDHAAPIVCTHCNQFLRFASLADIACYTLYYQRVW